MAVLVTGSWVTIQNSNTTNQNQAVTVPVDADICVVLLTGLRASGLGGTPILTELSLTQADETTFTRLGTARGIDGGTSFYQVEAWYLVDPPTGEKTLYWQAGGANEGLNIAVGFFKGIDKDIPIRDSEINDADFWNTVTTSLDNVDANDMSVIVVYDYNNTPDVDPVGYGQTAVWEDLYRFAGVGVAYEQGEDALYVTGADYGNHIAFALKVAAGEPTDFTDEIGIQIQF